ncbi:FYVE, RhoGEF and PH domain-containing protein 6 isoform X3 [Dendrobates tinctorius]|uniref:FYVE, RhoGEF and PH domain-containing protein 6 isoform X3 n=1 Tax=Dendrobates tinctorius TaxID=92724 RepID=UPI003CC9A4BE
MNTVRDSIRTLLPLRKVDIKKPPLAPKPKHAVARRPSPPPIAPKPDTVQPKVAPKKSKPTIAPKPKVIKSSSVAEDKQHNSIKSNSEGQEEHSGSENLIGKLETPASNESSTYIISPCSCNSDCSHKLGNGEYLKKKQKAIEQLENLENRKMCGQPVPCARMRRKPCSQQVKPSKMNHVNLKASIVEEKFKEVLTHNVLVNGYTCKHENAKDDTSIVSGYVTVSSDRSTENYSKSLQQPLLSNGASLLHSSSDPINNVKQCNGLLPKNESLKTEGKASLITRTTPPPPHKKLPVPKPRKPRTPYLVRQDCVDRTTESSENSVPTNLGQVENGVEDSTVDHDCSDKPVADREDHPNCSSMQHNRSKDQNGDLHVSSGILLVPNDTGRQNVVNALEEQTTPEENSNFIRCTTLSMSLPKQLKLIYEQQLPVKNNAAERRDELDAPCASSPRVAPKKPQRYSLPAAGLLKKAASEEKLLSSSNEGALNGISGPEGLCSKQLLMSEKPVWKLQHPILPFSRSPEALTTSTSNEAPNPPTKPRAKSLSAVDMGRIDKPLPESPKKNSLKKLLNLKLSVCIIKSDFQKFLSRGNLLADNVTSDIFSCTGQSTSPTLGKKMKPAKAQSADSFSPLSRKRQKHKNDLNNPVSVSLDENLLAHSPQVTSSLDKSDSDIPEYENVCHYEEIPEYENLPFTLVTDVNECDATIYEVEDPNEPSGAAPTHVTQSEPSQEDPDDDLGLIHSDEEEIINSSDEDDFSSDSSKTDLDNLEEKLEKKTRKKTKIYYIAKEIMSSEKVFVDVLKLLHIDFRYAVAQASRHLGKPVIEDKILNQILYYLPQLYELNRNVLRELKERMSQWSEQQKIADIFLKKGPYLKMYSTYIREFDRNVSLLDEQCKKNAAFAGVVKDFEMSPRCANLALKHYLLKPVQRIPQYRLLLTDYLQNLSQESSDYSDTQAALSVVIEVANHANDILKHGDNFQKLMQIQYSLNGHHEIVQPGRVFLKEGTLMKLSRKVMQPRMFFLMNDTLLYTTPVQSAMYKLNNMLSLAGMKVRKPTQEAYQNELNIESVERSFILSASSATERDDWLDAISSAIEAYAKKKITFNPAKSLEETDSEEGGDNSLGSKAPIWIPDGRATMCMMCTSEFTLTWRRHHCRACGKIVCQACSTNKYSLEYLKNHLARVCDHCFQELQKQDRQYMAKTGSPANHKSPSSALSSVLHSIPSGRKQKKIPAALKVSASTEDSTMSGYLHRSKGSKKPWKQLWFVVKNKVLYTYAASEDIAALESQPLLGFTVQVVNEDVSESKVINLLHKNTLFYAFRADDVHTTERWIEAFLEATVL